MTKLGDRANEKSLDSATLGASAPDGIQANQQSQQVQREVKPPVVDNLSAPKSVATVKDPTGHAKTDCIVKCHSPEHLHLWRFILVIIVS